jgi:hypothetical protein
MLRSLDQKAYRGVDMQPGRLADMISMIQKKCEQIMAKSSVQPAKIFSDIDEML